MTTQAETYTHIVGSRPLEYPWYQEVDISPDDWTLDDSAYDGWSVRMSVGAEDDTPVSFVLNHATVMDAARAMVQPGVGCGCSSNATEEARLLLSSPDDCDFDSDTADQLIQVAVFGKVVYG